MEKPTFIIAAAALSLSAFCAHAAEPPTVVLPLTPTVFQSHFTRDVNGLFIDEYAFSPSSFTGKVSVSLAAKAGPVAFFSAVLNGEGFSFFPESGARTFDFESFVTADVPLHLTVFGASFAAGDSPASGSYVGTVTASIPEPGSWGLAGVGLGVLGLMTRRRAAPRAAPL